MKPPRHSARSLALSLALAALLAPAPGRAADPDARCQKATAAALSKCLRNVGDVEAGCFKKTGAACLGGDGKVAKALDKLEGTIVGKCADAGAVAAAGYAPLLPAELATRFQGACVREIGEVGERVLGGPDAPRLDGASKSDAKCLLGAHKLAGELVGKAVGAVGRCAGKTCDARDLDKTDASLAKLEQGAVKKLDKSCADLPGLVGLDAAALAAESVDRSASAAAAPCDPLDPGHCLFPFPNDYFTVGDVASSTGRRLDLALQATPKNDSLDKPVDPASWNEIDGFSVGPALLFYDPAVDLTASAAPPITDLARSLDPAATALLFDAETGAQQLLWVERDESHEIESEQAIITRVGENLENGRRYLVAFRGLRDGSSALRPPSAVFAAYRDRTATSLLPVEARRPRMERLFDELAALGVARTDLQLAWDFTTQTVESTASRLLAMRDDAFENVLGTAAPAFAVDTVDEPFDANVLRRIDGTFQSPLYLTKGGAPGSELRLGADGLPTNEGDFFTASFRCVVPYAATTAGGPPVVPARPTLYGHGLLGSADEAGSSHVRAFANAHNFVVCGTDWSGFAEEDLPTVYQVLADFSNFPRFIDRQHQGVLNFMVLGRLLLHPDGFATDPAFQIDGQSVIDPSGLFYDGNSQGGILGGVLAAVAQDVERFVLGVPGINYSTLLNRSVDFEPFGIVLRATYPNGLDRSVLLGLAQIIWDRTDPNGHVRHTTSDTYPGTPAKKILYQVAFGDHQVAPLTVEVAARSNGAHLYTPALSPGKVVPEVTPYYGLTPIPAFPFDGSAVVIWDSGNPAPPIGTMPPPEILPTDPEWATLSPCAQNWDSDPHECPRRAPEARLQKSEFLKNDGAVVEACGGFACLAPTF